MPKKPAKNAFLFFMLDYKARCERNGERFPSGLRDQSLVDNAGAEWKVIPAAERRRYEDMAKAEKQKQKDTGHKETCWHNSFKAIDSKKMAEEEEKVQMNSYIENTVSSLTSRRLLSEFKFYVVHANYFCVSEFECYHPCELALAEFCFGEGVTNVYHTIIDPGPIPLGYRHDAMQKSSNSHKIPVENNNGERDLNSILMNIKQFLEPGRRANNGDYPPMFTLPDNVNLNTSMSCVKSVIKNLCENANGNDQEYLNPETFPVYSLEKLFFELQNACCRQNDEANEAFPRISMAAMELEKDSFNFTSHIACEFHYEEDAVEYCSKSFVQRWVYLMCDHCCQYLDIKMVPRRHCPQNTDVNMKRQARMEEHKPAPRPYTWVDHSKKAESDWVPVEQPPLARPTVKANLAAMLSRPAQIPFELLPSEDNYPAIPISSAAGRGRAKPGPSGQGRGGGAMSFAAAMKK